MLSSGVKYKDVKIGGGSKPQKGYLMIVDFRLAFSRALLNGRRQIYHQPMLKALTACDHCSASYM